jgi:hypothetical protein
MRLYSVVLTQLSTGTALTLPIIFGSSNDICQLFQISVKSENVKDITSRTCRQNLIRNTIQYNIILVYIQRKSFVHNKVS